MVLNMVKSRMFSAVVLLGCTASAAAQADQQTLRCPNGPGALFGVVAYQCANCSFHLLGDGPMIFVDGVNVHNGKRPSFTFNAEPVVLETMGPTSLMAGDVIVAVNGAPITTRSGADQFSYPTRESVITVRRGNQQLEVNARPMVRVRCLAEAEFAEVTQGRIRIRGAGSLSERTILEWTTAPFVDGVQYRAPRDTLLVTPAGDTVRRNVSTGTHVTTQPRPGRFGFAVGCVGPCTRTRSTDGNEYYKFEYYPTVMAVVENGIAHRAGLRNGDLIIEVDDLSLVHEPGLIRFFQVERRDRVKLTVVRGGRRIAFDLRAR
jgi:membrane-associated protease RseP (regulator of RpoE activity)